MFFTVGATRAVKPDPYQENRGQIYNFGLPIKGISVNSETALTYSAFFTCVRIISETIAMLPWKVNRVDGDKSRIPAKTHPLWTVLKSAPNDEMTSFEFRQLMFYKKLCEGNFYAEIERNRLGDIVALYPIHQVVEPDRDSRGRIYYSVRQHGSMPASKIYHVKGFSVDGLQGQSIINLAKDSIALGLSTQMYQNSFFANGASPNTVILNKGKALGEEAVNNLIGSFSKRFGGPRNANKPGYLDNGMDIKTVSFSPSDAKLIESMKNNITEIARWFRMPLHKLNELDRTTHNNIESQNIEFVTDTLLPHICNLEQATDNKLLKPAERAEYYTKINLLGLLRGDSKTRSEYYQKRWNMGSLTINQIRDFEDEDPIENGHKSFVGVNLQTLENAVEPKSDSDQQNNSKISAFSNVINDKMGSLVKNECILLDSLYKKSSNFSRDACELYATHAEKIYKTLSNTIRLYAKLNGKSATSCDDVLQSFAHQYALRSGECLDDAKRDGSVTELLKRWEIKKSQDLTKALVVALGGAE